MTAAARRELSLDRRGTRRRRRGPSESLLPPGRTDLSQTGLQRPCCRPAQALPALCPHCLPPPRLDLHRAHTPVHRPETLRRSACPGVHAGMALSWAPRSAGMAGGLTGPFLGSGSGLGGISKHIGAGCFFLLPVLCLITQDELKSQTSKLIRVQIAFHACCQCH